LDSLVKERLTGAIILVVLIVLLVPELLSGPSRSVPAPRAAVASSEEPPLRSYTINLADDSHGASASEGAPSASAQANGPAQPTPITESAAAQATDPGQDSPAESSSNAANPSQPTPNAQSAASGANPPGESWQEQPKAAAPHGVAASHGPAPQQQRSAVPDKAVAQPRVAADRVAAARTQTERSSSASERASTSDRSSKGDRAEASGSTGGWMVQLGVFSVRANAERLAQELRTKGFYTFVSENGGGGRPLWRVRAGPVAERAAAEQLSAKLRAAGHAGSVVPK
jgi:DedD protein